MKKILKVISCLIVFISIPAVTFSATFYMRHGLSTGLNDGSNYDNSFQGPDNVQWEKIVAGDTLYVCGGVYDDTLIIGSSGVEGNPITIRGDCSTVNANYENGVMGRVWLANISKRGAPKQSISLYHDAWIIIEYMHFDNPFGVRYRNRMSITPVKTHDTGTSDTVMTDSGESFITNAFVGGIIFNIVDGSRGIITANDKTTITVAEMLYGTRNDWVVGDTYQIVRDGASIQIGGITNNIIIRNNTFEINDRDIGFAIFGNANSGAVINNIKIHNNKFIGAVDEIAIRFLQSGKPLVGLFYNLTVSNNLATDQYMFFWGGTYATWLANMDPDGDGNNANDRAPYGYDFNGNVIEIGNGGWNVFGFTSLHEVVGDGANYIRNNKITSIGTQISATNFFQLNWNKDLIVEYNFVEGPNLKQGCDGAGIMPDWAWAQSISKEVGAKYISDGIIIRYNHFTNAVSDCTGKAIVAYRGKNIQIYGNLVTNSDVGIKMSDYEGNGTGNTVYNNTVINSGKGDCSGKTAICGSGVVVTNYPVATPEVKIKNNLIKDSQRYGIYDQSNFVTNDGENHNLIHNSKINDCQGAFGLRIDNTCGSNDIVDKDPLLLPDYKIGPESPAYQTGIDVGLSFNGLKPNIGYYEAPGIEPVTNLRIIPDAK